MLLYGCEVWSPLPKKSLKCLSDLSNKFLKVTLALGNRGAMIASMYWCTTMMTMENRILLNKLLFVHHLSTLSEESLAKQFYNAQITNKFPSVVMEVQEFLIEHNINKVTSYLCNSPSPSNLIIY